MALWPLRRTTSSVHSDGGKYAQTHYLKTGRASLITGIFPRAPISKIESSYFSRQTSFLAAKKISGHDDTNCFFAMVKPQPGDIEIVYKLGILLMWDDKI